MKYTIHKFLAALSILGLLTILPLSSFAQDFVYTPKNPAFGGSPLNYQWLMSSANTQNKFQENRDFGFNRDPLADFQQSLQRQVLSELTRNLVRDRFGQDLDLSQESRLEFGEFTIDVTPGANGVTIRIFNVLTGEETSITIPNING